MIILPQAFFIMAAERTCKEIKVHPCGVGANAVSDYRALYLHKTGDKISKERAVHTLLKYVGINPDLIIGAFDNRHSAA